MNLTAILRCGKRPGTPMEASVSLHPYRIPQIDVRHGYTLSALEHAAKTLTEACEALRLQGVPSDAAVRVIDHRGYFGDSANSLIEAVEARWEEPA